MNSLETLQKAITEKGNQFNIFMAELHCDQCGTPKARKMSGWARRCDCPIEKDLFFGPHI